VFGWFQKSHVKQNFDVLTNPIFLPNTSYIFLQNQTVKY